MLVECPGLSTFPYTLDFGTPQTCDAECPDDPLPGLWEIPIRALEHPDTGAPFATFDPVDDGDLVFLFNLYRHNFDQVYNCTFTHTPAHC